MEPIYSGNGALARMQVEELLHQGHSILLFCGTEQGQENSEPPRTSLHIEAISIQSRRDLGPNADFIGFSLGILNYWDRIREVKADAIIIDDWHGAMAAIALNKGSGIPCVYQNFRIFCRDPKFIPDPIQYRAVRALEQSLAEHAKITIQLSKDCAEWIRNNFNRPAEVLYPALKPAFIAAARPHQTKKYAAYYIARPIKLITFIRISPEKEIELLFALLAACKFPVHLKILGEVVNPKYKANLDGLIGTLKLQNIIEFDGRIELDNLINEIKAADAYIHPSRYEPFGISIMEAAYLGLPVIMDKSPKIGAGELLEDSTSCIRLDFDRVNEAAQKLFSIIQNSSLMAEIGKKGQAIAGTLTVKEKIGQLIEIIKHYSQ